MKTLEKHVALNASYRRSWQEYYASLTSTDLNVKLMALTSGMDSESCELCHIQAELVPYFFPHRLLRTAFMPTGSNRGFLPAKTREALEKAGFFSGQESRIDEIQKELNLPFEPLPELLTHSGLSYLPELARHWIEGKVVIDGGAFMGDTAKLFLQFYSPKTIFAIEPSKESFSKLSELVSEWRVQESIKPLRYMLSDTVGSETLWGSGVGASIIKKEPEGSAPSEIIPSSTIDTLVSKHEIKRVGFIKLDIEGNEMRAVRGAVETLRRDKPLLVISIYHTATDFFEIKPFLEQMDLGYRFLVRKISDDILKELVLICMPNNGEI
ncbi:MAG: FkbM family methyltransferase [Pseudomonadota bacterium]